MYRAKPPTGRHFSAQKRAMFAQSGAAGLKNRPPDIGATTRHVCSVGRGWPEVALAGLTWLGLAWPGLEWRRLSWSGVGWPGLAWPGLGLPGVPCLAVPCFALLWGWRTLAYIRQPPCAAIVIVFSFPRLVLSSCVLCTVSFALCLYYGVGT